MVGIRMGGRAVAVPASALPSFHPVLSMHDRGRRHHVHAALAPLYAAVRDTFRRRARAPVSAPLGGFDTCYNVIIRFDGKC